MGKVARSGGHTQQLFYSTALVEGDGRLTGDDTSKVTEPVRQC